MSPEVAELTLRNFNAFMDVNNVDPLDDLLHPRHIVDEDGYIRKRREDEDLIETYKY